MMDFTGTPTIHTCTVAPEAAGGRLDKFLHEQLPTLTRNQVQVLIAAGQVQNGETKLWHKNYATKPGETYTVMLPQPKPTHIIPNAIPLNIVYEDKHLLVLNKQSGMTVHPGAGTKEDTLVHALVAHCGDTLSGIGGVARPGLIHRLDRDTTGLLIVAKNDRAHIALSEQLRNRLISRGYLAICWGMPDLPRGSVSNYIGRSARDRKKMAIFASEANGKLAITHYELEEKLGNGGASLVRFKLETGRTHQIRVHAAHKKFPVLGDKVYGGTIPAKMLAMMDAEQRVAAKTFPRQALHAQTLQFTHPVSGKILNLKAEFPEDFATLLDTLRN